MYYNTYMYNILQLPIFLAVLLKIQIGHYSIDQYERGLSTAVYFIFLLLVVKNRMWFTTERVLTPQFCTYTKSSYFVLGTLLCKNHVLFSLKQYKALLSKLGTVKFLSFYESKNYIIIVKRIKKINMNVKCCPSYEPNYRQEFTITSVYAHLCCLFNTSRPLKL